MLKKYCLTLGTNPVPGVKNSANQKKAFGRMTIDICIECCIETHISQLKIKIMTQNFQDMILGAFQVHL